MAALVVALVAVAACGGRLDEEEIRAELSADGGADGGSAGGFEAGDGDTTGGDSGDRAAGGGSGAGSGAGASGGGGASSADPSSSGGGGGGGGGGDPETAPPPEGNGGATDVGVTETEIVVGNVSTLSGPVAGLFRGALVGTQAAYAYQNSKGGLYGRSFRVVSGDDNFDAGQNRSRHKELKDKVFAFSGSFSLFDAAGVGEMQSAGVVDVGRALLKQRQDMEAHFSPAPFQIGWPSTGCEYLKQRFGPERIKKMALFWGNAEAARNNAAWQQRACEAVGFEFVYGRELQATESNFTTDAIRMQGEDVQGYLITFDVTGIARFMKSMSQQGFVPPIRYISPAAYDSALFTLAGADVAEGIIIGQNLPFFLGEEADRVPELALFLDWMERVDPSQKVDLFAFYGWASARLAIEAMKAAGPRVTRAGVVGELQKIREWDNFGTTSPVDVAGKTSPPCELYMEARDGKFVRVHPDQGFHCGGRFVPYDGNGTPQV